METNPPSVAGMPSRVQDIFTPDWTVVVGGPASEPDPGKWFFTAYTEVTSTTTETARRLEERTDPSTSPVRRVEALGEQEGYRRYRNRSSHLFIVRSDGPPHLAAYFNTRLPDGVTEEQAFSDLIRLAEFARRV